MKQIECPNCKTVFTIDESQYQDIVAQVRKEEFDEEVNKQLQLREESYKKDLQLSVEQNKNTYEKELANKQASLIELSTKLEQMEVINNQKIKEAIVDKEKEKDEMITSLNEQLTSLKNELSLSLEQNKNTYENKLSNQQSDIEKLKSELAKEKELSEFKKKEALVEIERERDSLKNQLVIKDKDIENIEHSLKNEFDVERKLLTEQVEVYKNFKAQQSTKMIGESLEQYAMDEFNKVRSYAFPNAYFEKDNTIVEGEKGDFIYREKDENGIEILSIMFEMKNEADMTATKHKNEHFYKKLDSDRTKKNCEYAVLVSMLESDNELFNSGIVDVSYLYDKMYVIRPQLFVQIIGILRNAALSSLKYRQELAAIKERDLDITNFENEMTMFKDNFLITAKNFNGNLEKLDKNLEDSIKKLTTARDELRKAMKNLGTAENKIEDLSIKRLTKNNPTMKEKFDELEME